MDDDGDEEEGWMVPHGYLSDDEREGEAMDLDVIKTKEANFYLSLKEKVKVSHWSLEYVYFDLQFNELQPLKLNIFYPTV